MPKTFLEIALALSVIAVGCGGGDGTRPPPIPPAQGGAGGDTGGAGGGPGGSGGGTGGTSGTGGAGGTAGSGGGGQGGGGGRSDSGAPDSAPADAQPAGSDGPRPDLPPSAPGQGPIAMGRIVYSQDFENGMEGITRSPNGLPPERAVIIDDPLGQRGKVMRVIWQAGDNFRTSPGTQPRSWISAAQGYQITTGTKISIAWGFQWTTANMDAFFAQTIGPGPVWELRVRDNGRFQILCNKCGGNTPDMMMIETGRWYDFRVDMDWQNGGPVRFFINGQMVHQATMSGATANCHWDGGIYNTPGGTASNRTRTVYVSNLSIGVRE